MREREELFFMDFIFIIIMCIYKVFLILYSVKNNNFF